MRYVGDATTTAERRQKGNARGRRDVIAVDLIFSNSVMHNTSGEAGFRILMWQQPPLLHNGRPPWRRLSYNRTFAYRLGEGHEATDTLLPYASMSQATGHSSRMFRCTAALFMFMCLFFNTANSAYSPLRPWSEVCTVLTAASPGRLGDWGGGEEGGEGSFGDQVTHTPTEADPPTDPHQKIFPQEKKNEIYQRGPKLGVNFRYRSIPRILMDVVVSQKSPCRLLYPKNIHVGCSLP